MSPFNVAFDMGSFVKSDAVDVIINQPDYGRRLPGFAQGIRVPAESFHLHNKLQWCEFDLRTYAGLDFWAHSVIAVKGLSTASDPAMWRTIHRKHAGVMNAHRMGWWYYDMADGWYYPKAIASDIGEVYAQDRDLVARAPDPWRPDVALVIDEVAMSAYGQPGGPKVPSRATLCNLQWTRSAASGVPYDSYLALDLYARPELAKRYKAIVWSGFNAPDGRQCVLVDRGPFAVRRPHRQSEGRCHRPRGPSHGESLGGRDLLVPPAEKRRIRSAYPLPLPRFARPRRRVLSTLHGLVMSCGAVVCCASSNLIWRGLYEEAVDELRSFRARPASGAGQ